MNEKCLKDMSLDDALEILSHGCSGLVDYMMTSKGTELLDCAITIACDCISECMLMENDWK